MQGRRPTDLVVRAWLYLRTADWLLGGGGDPNPAIVPRGSTGTSVVCVEGDCRADPGTYHWGDDNSWMARIATQTGMELMILMCPHV